ncbi:MAG: hypothetical protein ABIO76_11200 [Ginsengibacter sp.]
MAPFFFAISTAYLKEQNYPDMNATAYMAVGQNLTEQVIKNERTVRYWWATEIEEEKWRLNHHQHNKFGLGTPYNNAVYLAFLSIHFLSAGFLDKCKELLPWYYLTFIVLKLIACLRLHRLN